MRCTAAADDSKEEFFMSRTKKRGLPLDKMVLGALLTALVVVLQFAGAFIKFGAFSVSLVMVPIALGAILCGPIIGAWLGLVFGVVVLLSGDAAWFMGFNAFGTIVTVILKGTLAGFASGIVYKVVSLFHRNAASIAAAIVCPIVNSGVFAAGCYIFFYSDLTGNLAEAGYVDTSAYIFFGLIGVNFLFELLLNTVLSPVIAYLVGLSKRLFGKK
jgi:uncharacterized membrane protein